MSDITLEKICDSLCDIIVNDLLKCFFVRIFQSKEGKIYLRIKVKSGRIHKNLFAKFVLHIKGYVEAAFNFYSKKDENLNSNFYTDFRLIIYNSGHYFKFNVSPKDYYNKKALEKFF